MNNTTINEKPEDPWWYPLIEGTPSLLYPMRPGESVLGKFPGEGDIQWVSLKSWLVKCAVIEWENSFRELSRLRLAKRTV